MKDPMSVAELIAALQAMPPDLPVYFDDDHGASGVRFAIVADAPKWAVQGISHPRLCWLSSALQEWRMPR